MLPYSDHVEPGQNKDMNNYFRQASVNLKEILKLPGVWDPFIIGYVEVGHHPMCCIYYKRII